MNYENDKKHLLYTVIAVAIAFAVYKISSVTFIPNITDSIIKTFAGECILASATVIAAILVKKIWTLKLNGKGLIKGLSLAWPMVVMTLFSFYGWLEKFEIGIQTINVPVWKIIMLVIAAILVGIGEELLIRGILINGLSDYYGKVTVSTIRKSIVMSGVVFGALHMFNVFIGVTFTSALIQAINAFLMGIFFGAVYVRSSKNLWTCIILHAAWDFVGFLNGGMLMGRGVDDTINGASFAVLYSSIAFMLYALFLLRNKKLKEFEEN